MNKSKELTAEEKLKLLETPEGYKKFCKLSENKRVENDEELKIQVREISNNIWKKYYSLVGVEENFKNTTIKKEKDYQPEENFKFNMVIPVAKAYNLDVDNFVKSYLKIVSNPELKAEFDKEILSAWNIAKENGLID